MSLEPELPFDFAVRGTAVSVQGSSYAKNNWKRRIADAARAVLPRDAWLLTEPLAVTIYIFPKAKMQGDVDNRVKPILDALIGCVYSDDEIIERILVQKFEPDRAYTFGYPSDALSAAITAEVPMIYVRLSGDLVEDMNR